MNKEIKEKAVDFMNNKHKGIWIPREITLNNNFTLTEKVLYSFIVSLCYKTGQCSATNAYLSGCLESMGAGCGQVTISKGISKLENLGYIKTSKASNMSGNYIRIITLNPDLKLTGPAYK